MNAVDTPPCNDVQAAEQSHVTAEQLAGSIMLSCWVAGQATFSVRAGAAGTSSYTATTPTSSVGLDITYAAVRA